MVALTVAAAASGATPRYSDPVVSSPADAPFTVVVLTIDGYCAGAILDEWRVLTAAHCVTGALGQVPAPGRILVAAGTNQVVDERPHRRADRARPDVADLRHPGGAAVRGFGWGESAPGVDDGREYHLDLMTRDRLDCPGAAGAACVSSPAGGGCFGDSGGPLVSPATGQLVASVAGGAGSASCMPNGVVTIVDLSAPGIGLFVRGDDAPPPLPRATAAPTLAAAPITGGAATCTPPAWSGAASTTTVFAHRDGGRVVQEGPSTRYVPQPSDAGHALTCRAPSAPPACRSSRRAATGSASPHGGRPVLHRRGLHAGARSRGEAQEPRSLRRGDGLVTAHAPTAGHRGHAPGVAAAHSPAWIVTTLSVSAVAGRMANDVPGVSCQVRSAAPALGSSYTAVGGTDDAAATAAA